MGEPATCDVPVDAAEPSREAAECMCGKGSEPAPTEEELASCVGSLFSIRNSVTLNDVCWSYPNEPQLSLAQAITEYANAYGTTSATSAECDDTPAFFVD